MRGRRHGQRACGCVRKGACVRRGSACALPGGFARVASGMRGEGRQVGHHRHAGRAPAPVSKIVLRVVPAGPGHVGGPVPDPPSGVSAGGGPTGPRRHCAVLVFVQCLVARQLAYEDEVATCGPLRRAAGGHRDRRLNRPVAARPWKARPAPHGDLRDRIAIKKRGGTGFRPGFTWLSEQGLCPRCCPDLTDMECGRYPEAEPEYPVIRCNRGPPPGEGNRWPWANVSTWRSRETVRFGRSGRESGTDAPTLRFL